MTEAEAIEKIMGAAESCPGAGAADLVSRLIGGRPIDAQRIRWALDLGVESDSLYEALDKVLSPDARRAELIAQMDEWRITCSAVGKVLRVDAGTITNYRSGRRRIPIQQYAKMRRLFLALKSLSE